MDGRTSRCIETGGAATGGRIARMGRGGETWGDPDPRFRWGSNDERLTGSGSLRSPVDLVLPEAPFTRPSRSRPSLRPTQLFVLIVVVVAAAVVAGTDTFLNKQYTLSLQRQNPRKKFG